MPANSRWDLIRRLRVNINYTVFSPISMDIQTRGVCSTYREKGEGHTGFWWGEKKLLGRPWRRWENNIKVGPQAVGWGGINWICLAQYSDKWRAVVFVIINLREVHEMRGIS